MHKRRGFINQEEIFVPINAKENNSLISKNYEEDDKEKNEENKDKNQEKKESVFFAKKMMVDNSR